ncbi:FecCD family ABC transporter permease [Neisseria sp. Ec49-e6-T10]|uniref:FecCD family ABC transporter permease n=1 Tax=Neisseria sp. Ec49-e6-T10 TaxID=3140744 RepID=UPI003EB9546E
MKRLPFSAMMVTSFALLILLFLSSLATGAISIPFPDLFDLVIGRTNENSELTQSIVWELRLPRTILCIVIGAILGLSGASLQGLFRNPLADPGIIGISAGAGLGAGLAIVVFPPNIIAAWFPESFDISWFVLSSTSVFAFVGSLCSTILVFRVGRTPYGTQVGIMLLSGVAIGALAFAALGFLQFIASDTQLRDLSLWQMGSLAGASTQAIVLCLCALVLMFFILFKYANGLNALLLGESEARHLGVKVETLKRTIIIVCALGVGLSVAVAGMIGFVGLIVPHTCRTLLGPNHRSLLPASMIVGSIILLLADIFARQVASPAEVPIGIITALIGAPFFLALLIRSKKGGA